MYSPGEPIGEIVGEKSPLGSRSRPLQCLVSFLSQKDNSGYVSGYIHVWGSWQIGKGTVIRRAIEMVRNSTHPVMVHMENECYEPLSPKALAKLVAQNLNVRQPSLSNRQTRFTTKNYEYLVDWIDKTLDGILNSPTVSAEVVVIQFRASSTDVGHDLLKRIFRIQPRHIPARKVIVQSRNALQVTWGTTTETIWLSAFKDDDTHSEVRDFIQRNLLNILLRNKIAIAPDVAEQVFRDYCGRHPGLLRLVCDWISQAVINWPQNLNANGLSEIVEDLLATFQTSWQAQVKDLVNSLSRDACNAAKNSRTHRELEHYGLVDSQGQPVKILRKYFQLTQEAGGTMMLVEMLSKLALSEAINKARPTLNRVWKEIFPPTPLYVAALKEATKEVGRAWRAEGISPLPQLNIEAAIRYFDWAALDVEKIRDLPEVSRENIIQQLITVVEDVDDQNLKEQFVSKVVEVAEEKFLRALALDPEGDQLWKSFVIESQRRLRRTSDEILSRISELDIALRARLVEDPDSGEVRTLTEVLGARNSIDGQTGVSLLRPSQVMAAITKAELWDEYQNLLNEWYSLRSSKRELENKVRPLEEIVRTSGRLVPELEREYQQGKQKLTEIQQKMDQIKAQIFAIEDQIRQINTE